MTVRHFIRWLGVASWVVLSPLISAADTPTKFNVETNDNVVVAQTDHRIAPLEIIIVDVFGERDLSKELRVQASGKITFPLLGDVDVAGKTTTEVEKNLKELLAKDYLVDPQVIVTVKEYRQRYVNVIGQVMKPGGLPLPGEERWTILDAIGQAGGLTRAANPSRIEFSRQGKIQVYSFDQLKKNSDADKKIFLEPGDTIYVRESRW